MGIRGGRYYNHSKVRGRQAGEHATQSKNKYCLILRGKTKEGKEDAKKRNQTQFYDILDTNS